MSWHPAFQQPLGGAGNFGQSWANQDLYGKLIYNLMKKITKFILAQHALANAFAMQSPEYGQALQQMGIQNPFSQGLPQVHLSPNF